MISLIYNNFSQTYETDDTEFKSLDAIILENETKIVAADEKKIYVIDAETGYKL